MLILIPSLVVHELAHAWVAWKLGDDTAEKRGRLTLNPLAHLDPLGTIAILFLPFGWAKPVPVDIRNFTKPLQGMMWVALAGPVSNVILAIASAIIVVNPFIASFVLDIPELHIVFWAMFMSIYINLMLAIFNMLPIPPLDGSRVVAGVIPQEYALKYLQAGQFGFILLFVLIATGSLPIGQLFELITGPFYRNLFQILPADAIEIIQSAMR